MQSFGIELNSAKQNNNKFNNFLKKINNSLTKQIKQAKLVKNSTINCDYKVIICGDFNSTPYSLPYRILKDNLIDSFKSKGSGLGTTYSLFNYPLRLDYFLVDPSIQIDNHQNFNLNLSDHEPILMNFQINKN